MLILALTPWWPLEERASVCLFSVPIVRALDSTHSVPLLWMSTWARLLGRDEPGQRRGP